MKNEVCASMKPSKNLNDIQLKKCPFCPKVYPYLSRVKKHIQSHTKEKPFKCSKCNFNTASEKTFLIHVDRDHGDKSVRENRLKFKCELCPYRAFQKSRVQSHAAKHKEERKFPCKFPGCDFKAKFSRVIWKHYNRLHRDDLPLWPCQVEGCAYRGKSGYNLKAHMIKHSTDRPFHCPDVNCSYRGKSQKLLNCHLKNVHCETVKWYNCPLAGCTFKTKHPKYLNKHHSLIHADVDTKTFMCSYPNCNFRSKTQKGVQDHATSRHEEIKPYACQVTQCNYRTALKRNLRGHVKIHGQSRPFPCPIERCEFRAKLKSSLKPHLKWHNKDPKFSCPVDGCTYLGRHKALLEAHVKGHRDYPDFRECPVPGCNYWARNPNTFKQHQSVHSSERKFACPFCPKYFGNIHSFERQIFSHTKEKPFKCLYCKYGSPEKKGLMEHYRVHHQGEKLSLEWLPIAVMCKYCSFIGIEELVLKHTASEHSVLTVNLERILLKVI